MEKLIEIDGREFSIKPYGCNRNQRDDFPFYINVTGDCNGNCGFCSNKQINPHEKGDLDLNKLQNILDQIHTKISRLSISGGETLKYPKKLEELLNLLSGYHRRITLNTNGSFLKQNIDLLNRYDIESIQLSRHHYNDEENNNIFRTKTISIKDIPFVKNELNADLRINCLLIKNHIDSADKVANFLENISETKIFQVGFISMMKVNSYTTTNFVDYRDISTKLSDNFVLSDELKDGDRCSCLNYAYIPRNGLTMFVYLRYTEKFDNCGRSLFYDCNGLREGY